MLYFTTRDKALKAAIKLAAEHKEVYIVWLMHQRHIVSPYLGSSPTARGVDTRFVLPYGEVLKMG